MNEHKTPKSAGALALVLLVLVASVANPAAALSGLTADFTFTPDDPHTGESISFDASSTTNVSANATYSWDYDGDGTYDATGQTVTHNFSTAGDHNVTLLVEDPDDGSSDEVTKVVSVHSAKDYEVTAALDNPDSTNASKIDVVVNGTAQTDLVAADYNEVLTEGTVVTFEYVDSAGNVTATKTYTAGENGSTITLNDATVTVTETEYTSSGGSSTSGSSSTGTGIFALVAVGGILYVLFLRDE